MLSLLSCCHRPPWLPPPAAHVAPRFPAEIRQDGDYAPLIDRANAVGFKFERAFGDLDERHPGQRRSAEPVADGFLPSIGLVPRGLLRRDDLVLESLIRPPCLALAVAHEGLGKELIS